MISRDNVEAVKTLNNKLCDRYEQFKAIHSEFLDFCSSSDIIETLEMNFDSSQKNLLNSTSSSSQYRLKLVRAYRLKAEVQMKKMAEKQELERSHREIEMKEDDILIGGVNTEEHNKALREALKRTKDFGITLNRDKCEFGVNELEFYGYKFTKDGLKPTHEKVRAVKEAKAPESNEAPHLEKLTHKDTQFRWGHEENSAFENLEDGITNESTMAFFNPMIPIVLRCEASFNEGLSSGLFQQTNKGLQPVHFIGRSMSDTEKRYSQTEKDALSIRWSKNRFSIYLLGAPRFKIITAHKPLIPMFNQTSIKLPPRGKVGYGYAGCRL
ncbi:unnamed protein product [Mytilus coruscus]|uniref:Reverse transcriptase/retrotransposon-derived protein RNase H-like domain-containing protein n=1 Tax=Mytilus coruscus TaxID=42192 RepID=A0A6J8BLH9_MYTCO|nr:unnamed protein product [Mytilus coruscus]